MGAVWKIWSCQSVPRPNVAIAESEKTGVPLYVDCAAAHSFAKRANSVAFSSS
jgi:hypothetical protein